MSETDRDWLAMLIQAAIAVGTLGIFGLAAYGVFFSDLSDAIKQRFETTIAAEREENVDLRRDRRELLASVDSLEDRRRILLSEVSELQSGWNQYLGQIYAQFVHDFFRRAGARLDGLRKQAEKARDLPEYSAWLVEGRDLQRRLNRQEPSAPDAELYSKRRTEAVEARSRYLSLLRKETQLLEEGRVRDALQTSDSAEHYQARWDSLGELTSDFFGQRIRHIEWDRIVLDSVAHWERQQPKTWRSLSGFESLIQRLNSSPDTADSSQTSFVTQYLEARDAFENSLPESVSEAITGASLINSVLDSGVLGRFLPRHKDRLRRRVEIFQERESSRLAQPLEVHLPAGTTEAEVSRRAEQVLNNIRQVEAVLAMLRESLEDEGGRLLK